MSLVPVFLSNMKDAAIVLQNADGTAFKTFLAGSTSGSRLKSLNIASDDTSAQTLQICKTIGAVDYVLGEISVPAGSGTNSTDPSINALSSGRIAGLQYDGVQRFLDVPNGTTIKIKSKAAVTAAKTIYIVGEYGDV